MYWASSVVVLSLLRRPDRREEVSSNLDRLAIKHSFFDAIDAKDPFFRRCGPFAPRVANAMSISRLLCAADARGDDLTVLFEDDARPRCERETLLRVGEEISRIRARDPGLLFYTLGSYPKPLYARGIPVEAERIDDTDSFRHRGFLGTHALVFTPAGRAAWQRTFPDSRVRLETFFRHRRVNPDEYFLRKYEGVGFRELLFDQSPGVSDIDPRGFRDTADDMHRLFAFSVRPIFSLTPKSPKPKVLQEETDHAVLV